MRLNLELDKLSERINNIKPNKIFVQLPEGLKDKIPLIKYSLKKYDTYFSLDPIFGACDLQENLANIVDSDLTIHFGHTCFYNPDNKTIFHPLFYDATQKEIENYSKLIIDKFEGKSIAIIFPTQYRIVAQKIIDSVSSELNIIQLKTNSRINCPGQILGCDTSTLVGVRDTNILYLGDGTFHQNAVVTTNNKYYKLSLESIEEIKMEDNYKKEIIRQELIKTKTHFAIYISSKIGQSRLDVAKRVRDILLKENKEVTMLVGDNISPEKLIGQGYEVLVNTACPRILDDSKNYKELVVLPQDVFNAFSKDTKLIW